MKPTRNRNTTSGSSTTASRGVEIGFAPEAKAGFDELDPKAQKGMRRKLQAYGENPSLGKPLVRDLRSFHRVTYGRVRCVTKAADGIILVLFCGLRKSDAVDDSYEIASAALASNDPEIVRALQTITTHYVGRRRGS